MRDCFLPSAMEIARNLNRYSGHLRHTQGYQKNHMIANQDGHPVLQLVSQGSEYQDYDVTHTELAAFLADLGPSAAQTKFTDKGKTDPGHCAKNKPQHLPGLQSLWVHFHQPTLFLKALGLWPTRPSLLCMGVIP